MFKLSLIKRLFDSWFSCIVLLLGIVFVSLLIIFSGESISNTNRLVKTLESSEFKYVGYSNAGYDNTYYTEIGYSRVESLSNEYYSSDIVMVDKGTKYYGNFFTKYKKLEIEDSKLMDKECSISSDFSRKYGISVGDTMLINRKYEYKVKYIFDDYYGLKEFFIDGNGLVVLGYNEEILKSAFSYKKITFAKDSVLFSDNDIVIKDEIIKEQKRILMAKIIEVVVGFLVVGFLLDLFFNKRNVNDFKFFKRISCNSKSPWVVSLLEITALNFILYSISLITFIVLSIVDARYFFVFIILFFSLLINIIKSFVLHSLMVKGDFYE